MPPRKSTTASAAESFATPLRSSSSSSRRAGGGRSAEAEDEAATPGSALRRSTRLLALKQPGLGGGAPSDKENHEGAGGAHSTRKRAAAKASKADEHSDNESEVSLDLSSHHADLGSSRARGVSSRTLHGFGQGPAPSFVTPARTRNPLSEKNIHSLDAAETDEKDDSNNAATAASAAPVTSSSVNSHRHNHQDHRTVVPSITTRVVKSPVLASYIASVTSSSFSSLASSADDPAGHDPAAASAASQSSSQPSTPSTLSRLINTLASPLFKAKPAADDAAAAAADTTAPGASSATPTSSPKRSNSPGRTPNRFSSRFASHRDAGNPLYGLDHSDSEEQPARQPSPSKRSPPRVSSSPLTRKQASLSSSTTTTPGPSSQKPPIFLVRAAKLVGQAAYSLVRSLGVFFYLFTCFVVLIDVYVLSSAGKLSRRFLRLFSSAPKRTAGSSFSSFSGDAQGSEADALTPEDSHEPLAAFWGTHSQSDVFSAARKLWKPILATGLLLLAVSLVINGTYPSWLPSSTSTAVSVSTDRCLAVPGSEDCVAPLDDGRLISDESSATKGTCPPTEASDEDQGAQHSRDHSRDHHGSFSAAAVEDLVHSLLKKQLSSVESKLQQLEKEFSTTTKTVHAHNTDLTSASSEIRKCLNDLHALNEELKLVRSGLEKNEKHQQSLQESIQSFLSIQSFNKQILPKILDRIAETPLSESQLSDLQHRLKALNVSLGEVKPILDQEPHSVDVLKDLIKRELAAALSSNAALRNAATVEFVEELAASVKSEQIKLSKELEEERNIHQALLRQIATTSDEFKQLREQTLTALKQQSEQKASLSATAQQEVKRLIQDALSLYDADKIGLVDFALVSAGAAVIESCTSASFSVPYRSFLGFTIVSQTMSPSVALSPDNAVGNCWSFEGTRGQLTIELSAKIAPTSFTLEHAPQSVSLDRSSAPREIEVYALQQPCDKTGFLLGKYTYDLSGAPLQRFDVQSPSPMAVKHVRLSILSNYGEPKFTCLYRFRVHGSVKP